MIKGLSEAIITKTILEKALEYLSSITSIDVIIVGAGPAGLTSGYYLAKNGINTLIIERRISFGGGIGGGGMLFPRIVLSKDSRNILKDINCKYEETDEFLVVDPVELMNKLASAAIDAGCKFLLGVTVDDAIFRRNTLRVAGAVIQWTAVIMSGIHVDPLSVESKALIDATGHDAEVLTIVARKIPELGINILGEKSMDAVEEEKFVIDKTGKVVNGLYAADMAVATLHGGPRMGPIFSSMLLSGKKVAEIVINDLEKLG